MNLLKKKNNISGIYLDYAATTPVSERVYDVMSPYFSDKFANPSSLHVPGQKAQADLDSARQGVADVLEVSWKEVFFTSSATHSINLAIRGAVKAAAVKNPHIITTNIEHSAVLNTCRDLENEGVEVTYINTNEDGLVSAEDVKNALQENTVLVSVMYVNNEIGTVQPIAEIANAVRDFRNSTSSSYPLMHTDAVQAANYLDVGAKTLGMDLMTLSGHKIYGPKGSAILYKREAASIEPIISGGEQERKMYAGTENMPAIIGFAEALKETEELKEKETKRVSALRDLFIDRVLSEAPGVGLNGSKNNRVANNINIYFENISSESLIPLFDSEKIYVSGGSACTSRTPEPSHVISALGKDAYAKNSIRVTLGRHTTKNDIEKATEVFIKIAKDHK